MKAIIYLVGSIILVGVHTTLIAQAPQTIIDSNAVWKYWANAAPPNSNNWKGGAAFDDSNWPSGQAPLGYSPGGVDSETTTVGTGCPPGIYNCAGKFPTIYFRKTFTISNINDYQKFIIHYKRDDGIALYVNGAEVKRENLPTDVVLTHTMSASSVTDEAAWKTITSDVSTDNVEKRVFLHTGTNTIAAEVHQGIESGGIVPNPANPLINSTDLRFGFWLEAVPVTTTLQHKILRGPYLQMGTTTSMTIRWSTEALSKGQVRYSTLATDLTVGNVNAKLATEIVAGSDHQIKLSNLIPNQKYYYIIEAAGPPVVQLEGTATASSLHYFYTAPLPGTAKKTRIWALGDFGTNNARQDSVINSFKTFLQQKAINNLDLWLWMGDNAYDWGLQGQYQDNVFDKTKARYDWIFRQTPFYATPGNHDYQNNYLAGGLRYDPHPIHYYDVVNNFTEATDGGGGEPSHREEYYSFNYNNIHIVSLDSYGFESGQGANILTANGPQVTWLKQDLAKAQADPAIHWIIAYWHHPPYTMGSYDSDTEPELVNIRTNFLPILEQYKVDLVINGHSHVYERSRLMKGHFNTSSGFSLAVHNPFVAGNAQSSGKYDGSTNSCFYFKNTSSTANEGTIYVVNGAGGRGGGTQPMGRWPHPAMESKFPEGGSMYLEVDGKRLDAKFINEFGVIKDQFTIIKDSDGFAIPPTDGTTRSAVCECTDNKGFTHYADQSGNLLLSIKKYNNAIGTAGVAPFDLKVGGSVGVKNITSNFPTNYVRPGTYGYRTMGTPWAVFNRYWTINPGTELTGNSQVIVRQYYKEDDLITAFNALTQDPTDGPGGLSLRPYKINDPNGAYTINPTGGHTNIPTAGAYNRQGAWIYSRRVDGTNGAYPTTHWFMRGILSSGDYATDYVVGRLKGGGGIGVSSALNSPNGNRDRASQMWDYLVSDTEPPAGWNTNQFYDIRGWERGFLPLGYSPNGEDGELTQIRNGCPSPNEFNTNCPTKTITTYFRGSLNYGGATYNYQSYILNYRRNDGVIIYIDGKEVLPRDPNMPSGPITPTTLATAVANEYEWRTVVLPASAVTGFFMAAELHQSSPGSNDLHLNIELIGSLDIAETPLGLRVAAPVSDAEVAELPTLYPNPVTQAKVFFTKPLNYQTLRLTDMQGKTYRYMSQPGVLTELDVATLPAGTYILTSQGADKPSQFKLVKQ
ncbi:metallophosphoesterase [Spirosoma gilvum]